MGQNKPQLINKQANGKDYNDFEAMQIVNKKRNNDKTRFFFENYLLASFELPSSFEQHAFNADVTKANTYLPSRPYIRQTRLLIARCKLYVLLVSC